MKRVLKSSLAILLSVLCVVYLLPQSVLAELGKTSDAEIVNESEYADYESASFIGEMEDLRTRSGKTFRMDDGSFRAVQYAEPVHFEKDGKWAEYDNTLVLKETEKGKYYSVTESDIDLHFAADENSPLFSVGKDGKGVAFVLDQAQNISPAVEKKSEFKDISEYEKATVLTNHGAKIVYSELLKGVDFEYIVTGAKVKENILVKERMENYRFSFRLAVEKLTIQESETGEIVFLDEAGEISFIIPQGYMYDAKGNNSEALEYALEKDEEGNTILVVIADSEWINDPERAFPVCIDPTIMTGLYLTNEVDDARAYKYDPTDGSGNDQFLMCGGVNSTQMYRIFVKLNTLPDIPVSSVIVNAHLNLRQMQIQNNGRDYTANVTSFPFAARMITSSWTESSVCWNNMPAIDSTVLDYRDVTASSGRDVGDLYQWDITKAVQKWYTGEENNGIAVYPVHEYVSGGAYASTAFYSSENPYSYNHTVPVFEISYRDQKGLEGIWTYSSQNADAAGTGYVNGYNGNLVFVHNDMNTLGSVLPVAVSHVFNSYQKNQELSSYFGVGKGWKLSVQETFKAAGSDDLNGYYVYTDSDGTELYFFETQNGELVSEDGYDLTVTYNSANHTFLMTDDAGNKKFFNNSGFVSYIEDVLGNRKEFNYSAGKILSVRYVPANGTAEYQLSFSYNGNNALKQIINCYDSDDYVSFYYSTTYNGAYSNDYSGYLRKIEYHNNGYTGNYCLYEYDSNGNLISAKDGDTGYKIAYTYGQRFSPQYDQKKVYLVKEYGGSSLGQTVGYFYEDKKFTVRTSGTDDEYGNSDDLLTNYMFDNFGRAICSDTESLDHSKRYGAASVGITPFVAPNNQNTIYKNNHKITSETTVGTYQTNLLRNGSMESNAGWSSSSSGSGYRSSRMSIPHFYGTYVYELSSAASNTGYARVYQNVSIPHAGTYTLSAYVKTASVSGNGGAYLILGGTSSEYVKGTTNVNIHDGWQRISVTKTFTSAGTYTAEFRLANASGKAYFDCVQLEEGKVPSHYNFLSNSAADLTTDWTGAEYVTDRDPDTNVVTEHGNVIRIDGEPTTENNVSQSIVLGVPKETTFVLSGWAKADAVFDGLGLERGTKNTRKFALTAKIDYYTGDPDYVSADFNPDYSGWQYACAAVVPRDDVYSITVYLNYDHNVNTAYFDDIALTIEPVQTYKYDENTGKLETTTNADGNQSLMEYANNVDLSHCTSIIGEQYDYTYKTVGGINTHLVDSVTKTSGTNSQTLTYDYDAYGNVISSTLSKTNDNNAAIVKSIATYLGQGKFLNYTTASNGGVTAYTYNAEWLLTSVKNANNYRTAYTYDNRNRTTSVYADRDNDGTADSSEEKVQYTYTNNRLTGITTATSSYTIVYDAFGNMTQVKAGNNILATYTYGNHDGKLQSVTDGNGNTESYVYDELDRTVSVLYNGNALQSYVYDANGAIAEIKDQKAGITHTYEYDSLGRLIRAWQKDTATGEKVLAVENLYDSYGRADKSTYVVGNRTLTYDVAYKTNSNLIDHIMMPNAGVMSEILYSYDYLERLTQKNISFSSYHDIYEEYEYETYTDGVKTYTSSLVSTLTLKQDSATTAQYSYTYDSLGNITEIRKNGTTVSRYEYDALNQLVREDDCAAGTATIFTYDKAGNITAKYVFPWVNSPSSILMGNVSGPEDADSNYTYSSSTWGDLLTGYNGTTINYDDIGNPTNWRNARIMVWDGKQLTAFTRDALNHSLSFSYNADGIRTRKTNSDRINGQQVNDTHDYILDGTNIMRELITHTVGTGSSATTTTKTLYYLYDASGSVAGLIYNNSPYYFQKNIQGDIIRICNAGGDTVVEYTYDAWGKVLSVTGTLASTLGQDNPFRYRGYYYDTETGFYYLQTRYYDPEVGRFLNADVIIGANGDIPGYNMFAYCSNNPVMGFDPTGRGFLDFWDDIGDILDDIGEFFVDVGEAIVAEIENIGDAFISSIEVDAGTGWGFGAEVNDVGCENYWDYYVGFDDGELVTGNVISSEISIGFYKFGDEYRHCSEKGDEKFYCESCKKAMNGSSFISCDKTKRSSAVSFGPISIKNNGDICIGFSASAHLVYGGHAACAFNLTEFFGKLFD